MGSVAKKARRQVDSVARDAAPWVERLARAGYFSRGVVYALIALLAARAAFEQRHPAGPRGAMLEILRNPFGRVVLPLLAVGLLGYALWSVVQATLDPERKGTDAKGLFSRAKYLITGVFYTGLAASAARLAAYGLAERDNESAGNFTAPVMAHPLGRWVVAAAGVGLLAYGLWQIYRAFTKDPEKRLDLSSLRPKVRKLLETAGRAGIAARGVVFAVVGVYLVVAALQHDPNAARTPSGALESVRQQPHGTWILAVIAVGLAAYGVFEMVKARYRVIRAAR
ncbi:MAG TPA: DUF1206 domain-containing protein [Longimicrobium sp.]|nr:DUF1206 domain-containing protein [Longimicrobium sp.]